MTRTHSAALAAAVALTACAGEAAPDRPDGPALSLQLGALDYPGATDVCYAFSVVSGQDQLVIARGETSTLADTDRNPAYAAWGLNTPYEAGSPLICASRFGNGPGGAWSYIAPCDASPAAANHTVTLWLEQLFVEGQTEPLTAGVDYQDPCPTGCALSATCQENADTPVRFDITLMRRAQQGFFDVAVSFDGLFCSAKLDCLDPDEEPLALLHDPEFGSRGQTAVLGLACTAGPGAEPTVLLRDPITITCGPEATVFTLDPAQPEGNVYSHPDGDSPAPSGSPVWQYAVYAGQEDLQCGADACQKVYWNLAIGFNPAAHGCTLTTTATAGTASSLDGLSTPQASTWPLIVVDVDLTGPTGGLACERHPLNGEPEGVSTSYTDIDEPWVFSVGFDGVDYIGEQPTVGTTCLTILQANPSAADGVYLLDPDGPGGHEPFQAYCDMTTDGGGWTLVANQVPSQLIGQITTADVWPENEASLSSSFRIGNARLATLQPQLAWRMTSANAAEVVVDRGFASPACVIDWLQMIGPATGCGSVPDIVATTTSYDLICGRFYTDASLSVGLSATTPVSNCSLGIGQNNGGQYCSMRMANTSGGAFPCNISDHTSLSIRLWSR